ncbi:hypothetical protein [Pseudomonas sp. RIT357]|uniref:hypothetical protein n=1 Tax=Pseudomonas sp. RIT357 TaxID=1470593 RepID=UPI0012DE7CD8|nr:hypothetical protein [Pseudomonas sp. RIT357]
MENFFSALKLLIPMLLTPIINRFISTFRIRQLYLSFDEVLPCVLPETIGFVASVNLYNKGKDKEKAVEVSFPNCSLCQVLASNYSGVSVESNKLFVDRILPKQTITLSVYLNSTVAMTSLSKPTVKSEDANGKVYNGRGNVPPSMGPAVMGLSIGAATLITFMYIMLSGSNIFYPYYALRYNSLMAQGVTPSGFSDNYLVSKSGLSSESPIKIDKPYVENSKIVLPLKIKNITSVKIKLLIFHELNNPDYKKENEITDSEISDLRQRVDAWRVTNEKYGYSSKDQLNISGLVLEAGEERTVLLAHTVLPATTLDNFNFYISVQKGAYEDESFRDYYNFSIHDYKWRNEVSRFLEALRH